MLLVLNLLLKLFRRSEQPQEPSKSYFQAFILEPILTPSAFVDNPFDCEEMPDADDLGGDDVSVGKHLPRSRNLMRESLPWESREKWALSFSLTAVSIKVNWVFLVWRGWRS